MKKSLLTLAISILMSGCSINSNPGVGEKLVRSLNYLNKVLFEQLGKLS